MNSFYKKLDELKILISDISPDIICLQETNFTDLNAAKLPYFNEYNKCRTSGLRASGGVTIYISSLYPSKQIFISTHLEAIAASVKLNDIEVNLCNIYLPNQHTFSEKDIENIIKQLPKPFIITGDFNSHNIIWGSQNTDNRGKAIEKILESENLVLLNSMEPTRINPINGNLSNIDLTFSNASLAQRLDWSVSNNITSSDHFPIVIQLVTRHNDSTPKLERWNLKNPDWPLFSQLLEDKITNINLSEIKNTEELVDEFTESIISSANLCIGISKSKTPKPKVPWWNLDIKKAIKDKNDALKKFQKTNNQKDFIQLKQLRAKSKFLIKSSKKFTWEKFTSSINEKTDSKLVWNKIQSLKGLRRLRKINLINTNTNLLLNNIDQISNNLGEYFYNNSSNNNYKPNFLAHKDKCEKEVIINTANQNHADQILINKPINLQEITNMLKKCKSNSPGPDSIPYSFIQNFSIKTLEFLLSIYNRIWNEGHWPKKWKAGTIIPILKPEKNQFKTEGYRPITLLNTMCKLFEKIINHRLSWFLEKISFFSPKQNGFRKNRCTMDSLHEINEEIKLTLENKQIMGVINLDIAKAYDTTWRHNIITKLNTILCQGRLLNIITNFTSNRKFQVKANNHLSREFTQENGVPQGSALSVTLFLIAINDITQNCSPPVKCNLFADDFNYWCRSNKVETVQNFLQITSNNLEKWANKTGFNFSPEKSSCSAFTKKRVNDLVIKLNDTPIANKDTVKMLGVIFDKRQTWSPYIKHLKKTTSSSLKTIKILSHTSWGGDSKSLTKIYNATIQSKINYASILYRTAAKSSLKLIDTVNNSGLRLAIGAFRSSPTLSIYNIAGIPPPTLRRIELSIKNIARLASRNGDKYSNINNEIVKLTNEIVFSSVKIIPRESYIAPPWENNYQTNTELSALSKPNTAPEIFKRHFQGILDDYKNFQKIYTDASKSCNGVGIAIILENQNLTFKLPNDCSIFSAEALAILKAIEIINTSTHTNFLILSDSLSAINSVKNKTHSGDIAILIQNKIDEAKQKKKQIILTWIPGHTGIPGNETADTFAKMAISDTNTPLLDFITYDDFKNTLKTYIRKKWHITWNSQNTKLNQIKSTTFRWDNSNLNRKEETALNRLRIGHTRLTHGFLMSNEEPPFCEACGHPLTVKHILTECHVYDQERMDLNMTETLDSTLGPHPDQNKITLKFLKLTNLINKI